MSFVVSLKRWLQRRERDAASKAWRAKNVGPGAYLDDSVQVLGWRRVRIGAQTIVSADSWLNVNNRAVDEPAIVIGANCFIGRRNFLSAGSLIRIGDYALTGVDCHFLGSDHLHATPFAPYATTGTTEGGEIVVGVNCWLGASVTVLKGVTIGFGSIIGAGSIVTRDVPPFSVAVGSPARVVKRFDVARNDWIAAEAFGAEQAARIPSEDDYLAQLRASHPVVKGPRIAAGPALGDL